MATWSAPGKVFLFGEHAVVYGKPGLAMAIQHRVSVTVRKKRRPGRVKSPYISECLGAMGVRAMVYVRSQLPSSSGLGSSAAVTVATLSAINEEFGKGLSREEVARQAFEIEKRVQKGRASATDTYVSSFGGVVLIEGAEKRRLPPVNLPLVVGNSRVSHNTSQMVERVARERERHPGIVNPLLDAIGEVTREALLQIHDLRALGNLMNTNHALLDALGVGHPSLTRLVLAARSAGAFGAKTTGAGGGGCMIALAPNRARGRVAGALRSCDAQAIVTTLDTEGARREKE
ncbi:MAG TPA: mevalonate kinase [Methanomicrobiales archaeon]|nr:mevalonate kinase [Methanomicrobiales archaeon]